VTVQLLSVWTLVRIISVVERFAECDVYGRKGQESESFFPERKKTDS